MQKNRIIGLVVILLFLGVVAYFFISSEIVTNEVPPYVTGEMRMLYEWAKVSPGKELLEQLPCYCGCKFTGHKHARHCFWKDNGNFDKHGITCSVCFDITKKAKEMHEQGNSICEIRKDIDSFYAPTVHLSTETPMPEGCRQND